MRRISSAVRCRAAARSAVTFSPVTQRRDPLVGYRLREAQYLNAVGEHRRAPLAKIEPPLIDLREVRDQIGLEIAAAANQLDQLREQLIARKPLQRRHEVMTSQGHAGRSRRIVYHRVKALPESTHHDRSNSLTLFALKSPKSRLPRRLCSPQQPPFETPPAGLFLPRKPVKCEMKFRHIFFCDQLDLNPVAAGQKPNHSSFRIQSRAGAATAWFLQSNWIEIQLRPTAASACLCGYLDLNPVAIELVEQISSGFRISDFEFRISDFEFRVSSFEFRVFGFSGFELQVFGFRGSRCCRHPSS